MGVGSAAELTSVTAAPASTDDIGQTIALHVDGRYQKQDAIRHALRETLAHFHDFRPFRNFAAAGKV